MVQPAAQTLVRAQLERPAGFDFAAVLEGAPVLSPDGQQIVFVASKDASAIPSVRANVDRFLPGLNGPPTTNRRFAADDDVDLYAEVYGAMENSAVKTVLTVRNDVGEVVRAKTLKPFPSDKCLAGIRCLAVSVMGALSNHDDGSYILSLSAEQGTSSTAREVRLIRSSPQP